jgi:dolichol-phosphate mannosyltransferase
MTASSAPLIELVIPVFNEAAVIEQHLQQILRRAAPASADDYRLCVLLVDDGSRDHTAAVLRKLCDGQPHIRHLAFTRNFGKEAALSAGLDHVRADADAVILLDSDLQHPPELIPQMVALWRAGSKVVEARKQHRGTESLLHRTLALGFYRLFRALVGLDLGGQTDFKLLDRTVVRQYCRLPERGRFFRGLIQWMNYPTATIPFDVPDRPGGSSSRWSRLRLLHYAVRNITAFSAVPLQLISWCGLLSLLVGLIFGFTALIQKINGQALDGFTTVILLLIFFSAILMLSLGVIGHYLARIHEEIKRRPLYLLHPSSIPVTASVSPDESPADSPSSPPQP